MDNKKYCWYCGKVTMKPVGSHYECSSCGATWNEIANSSDKTLVPQRDPGFSKKGVSLVKTSSPSHSAQETARKAREAKGGKA